MNNNTMKYVILALALLYVVSPVDFMPSPSCKEGV